MARDSAPHAPLRYPLEIQFEQGSTIAREESVASTLPIVRNGPPGTFVVFADGTKIPLPSDQIVSAVQCDSAARVTFGGMSLEGVAEGYLVFHRTRDILPPAMLSPQRGVRMTLPPSRVSFIKVQGDIVWPQLQ